ncbi:hypothetical protein HYDPIDRAFT_174427 [Hydnomerulius pinastri MD-312]|nr:hypothetical protein HYDPIDRAFT_174427 [Hydnomerulius pinastri MD-312]
MSGACALLHHLTSVYLALLITGGQVGLPIIVLTALTCKKLSWHPTLINLCTTWIIYSIIYCLYLKNFVVAPRAVVAGLAVVVQTWTTIQHLQCAILDKVPRALHLFLMVAPPYLVFIAFSVGAGISVYPSNGLYCTIYVKHLELVVPSFCAGIMIIVLCFEATISIQYYRQWREVKKSFPLVARKPSNTLYFRVGLFCLYSWVTLT